MSGYFVVLYQYTTNPKCFHIKYGTVDNPKKASLRSRLLEFKFVSCNFVSCNNQPQG